MFHYKKNCTRYLVHILLRVFLFPRTQNKIMKNSCLANIYYITKQKIDLTLSYLTSYKVKGSININGCEISRSV